MDDLKMMSKQKLFRSGLHLKWACTISLILPCSTPNSFPPPTAILPLSAKTAKEEEVVFLKLLLTVISCMTNLKFLGLVMILVQFWLCGRADYREQLAQQTKAILISSGPSIFLYVTQNVERASNSIIRERDYFLKREESETDDSPHKSFL